MITRGTSAGAAVRALLASVVLLFSVAILVPAAAILLPASDAAAYGNDNVTVYPGQTEHPFENVGGIGDLPSEAVMNVTCEATPCTVNASASANGGVTSYLVGLLGNVTGTIANKLLEQILNYQFTLTLSGCGFTKSDTQSFTNGVGFSLNTFAMSLGQSCAFTASAELTADSGKKVLDVPWSVEVAAEVTGASPTLLDVTGGPPNPVAANFGSGFGATALQGFKGLQTVIGSGFAPNAQTLVYAVTNKGNPDYPLGRASLGNVTTDADGDFSAQMPIPQMPDGTYKLVAEQTPTASGGPGLFGTPGALTVQATSTLTVTGLIFDWADPNPATIGCNSSGAVTGNGYWSGSGLDPNANYTITLWLQFQPIGGAVINEPGPGVQAKSNGAGQFNATLASGEFPLVLQGQTPAFTGPTFYYAVVSGPLGGVTTTGGIDWPNAQPTQFAGPLGLKCYNQANGGSSGGAPTG